MRQDPPTISLIHASRITRRALWCGALLATAALWSTTGCGRGKQREPAPSWREPTLSGAPIKTPPLLDLKLPINPAPSANTPEIVFTEPVREPLCHTFLERDGAPAPQVRFESPGQRALRLEACGAESWRVMPDGRFYVTFATPTHTSTNKEPVDQRVSAYDAKGALRWSFLVDRSQQAETLRANHRGAFLEPLPPHLFCGGTLWQSGVQAVCVREADGAPVWRGLLGFWSGIVPRGLDRSLFVADMTGLRRHYPFDGVEQRFARLPGPGGRAAFYETDGARFFFSANRSAPVHMTAVDMKTMERVWTRQLPGPFTSFFSHASASLGLVFFQREDELWALDAKTGDARLRMKVGHGTPIVATGAKYLYVMLAMEGTKNLIQCVDPKTGTIRWSAVAPPGTLRMVEREGVLMVGSVRTVQRVREVAAPSGGEGETPGGGGR